MAKWRITAPDGTVYNVEGKDKEGAMRALSDKIAADVRSEYQNLPTMNQIGTAGGDVARIMSNLVTGGYRDKIAPYLGSGRTPEEEQWESTKSRIRAGSAATGAELVPMLAAAPFAAKSVPGILRNAAIGSGEGAAFAGLQAGAHGEPVLPAMGEGALFGGGVNVGGQALKAAAKAAPSVLAKGGLEVAKGAGKLNWLHGLATAAAGLGANAMPTSPVGAATGVGLGLGIPIVGALGRAITNKNVRSAATKAAKDFGDTMSGKIAEGKPPQTYWDPVTRRWLTSTGVTAQGTDRYNR